MSFCVAKKKKRKRRKSQIFFYKFSGTRFYRQDFRKRKKMAGGQYRYDYKRFKIRVWNFFTRNLTLANRHNVDSSQRYASPVK